MLHISLLDAERKWATAMDLQQELTNAGYEIKKLRHNIKRQFSKAVKLSADFLQLCREVGTEETILHAEAYNAFMEANLAIINSDFSSALTKFKQSSTILEKLSQFKDMIEKLLYRDRLEMIENNIRLCQYNLESTDKILDASKFKVEEDDISKRLKELQSSEKKGETFSITYNSVDIPIKNEKLKVMFEKVNELEASIEAETDLTKKVSFFPELFNLLADMVVIVKKDKQDESENMVKVYNKLLSYLSTFRFKLCIRKNLIYLENYEKVIMDKNYVKNMLDKESFSAKVKPQEMIKLFNNLLEYQNSLSSIEKENNEGYDTTADEFAMMVYSTSKKFYSSLIYLANKKLKDTYNLMTFLKEEIKGLHDFLEVHKLETELEGKVKALDKFVSFILSLVFVKMEEVKEEKTSAKLRCNSNMYDVMNKRFFKIDEEAYNLFKGSLKFDFEEYKESFASQNFNNYTNVINFPPKIKLLNPKPIIYDLVYEKIDYPAIEQKETEQGSGMLGRVKSFFWS